MSTRLSKAPAPAPELSGREVFEILVRQNAAMLSTYLHGLVSARDVVDDLFQETMLIAWRRLPDYDATRPFGPWIRGIARHLVIKQRSARREIPSSDVLDALDQRFDEAEQRGIEIQEERSQLRRCLELLPDILRDAIRMTYERGMSAAAAGRELRASEEAVKKRLQRARAMLGTCLRRREVTP